MAIYSELNSEIGTNGLPDIVTDADDVNCSIENILGTKIGERWFEPNFGSNLRSCLYKPIDDASAQEIRTEVTMAIALWENRVVLYNVTVVPEYDAQTYLLTIPWRWRQNNSGGALQLRLNKL